jgi:inner membrane protein
MDNLPAAPQKIGIKALIISGLVIGLFIPTLFIQNIVGERKARQAEAFQEVSSKWANTQTLAGPIVSIPYWAAYKDTSGNIVRVKKYIHALPDELDVEAKIQPEKRYRGIYEVVVYKSELMIKGAFAPFEGRHPDVPADQVLFDQAFVSIGISDLRGIKENVQLNWADSLLQFNSGIETNDVLSDGISAPIQLGRGDSLKRPIRFSVKLTLNGSQMLHVVPIGKETRVAVTANWPTPSFSGAFLPDFRSVMDTGFVARWKVLHLNRNYPQTWLNDQHRIDESQFGVTLINLVDNYAKTDRSVKYAILIIALTFLIFYFLELMNGKIIHPLQYILVGFALCLFYVLLLSISEHIHFNWAYIIASTMTIGLISWYSISILEDKRLGQLVTGNLILIYGFIFSLIQLEDFALLIGSVGLFIILALVMYFSRRINWSSYGRS